MINLKEEIKNHYQAIDLTEEQLNTLKKFQPHNKIPFNNWNYSIAASLFFVLIFTLFSGENKLENIAHEVVYNHNKNLPSEFLANKITDLNAKFMKLDFKLKPSSKINQFTIIGGRYCSIQGTTAAQIKMKHLDRRSTLYQSSFMDINQNDLPYKLTENGVKVLIWLEGDILFAKATDI